MSKLTCRECGQDEHPGKCRPDKLQAGKLQARIKELEELIPTKDEAVRVLNYLIEMHKPNYHYAHNSPHFYSIYHAFNKCLICSYISKLQKIIDLEV